MSKRLEDLYITGRSVEVPDPKGGEPVVVWIEKLNSYELDVVMNRANRERAKVYTLKRLPEDSEEKLTFYMNVSEAFQTRKELIDFISQEDYSKARRSAEAEVAEKENWSKDDYLEGLQESWDTLEQYFYNEDYPEQYEEAHRVFDQLVLYKDEVEVNFQSRRNKIITEQKNKSHKELEDIAVEKLIEIRADARWIDEFRRSQVWLAVHEKEGGPLYFTNREAVNRIHPTILTMLQDQYEDLSVGPEEGKDLQAPPSS